MVVFTCNHCGESLQKPKVEKHYAFACRNVKSLTCVDCFKYFRGEEYTVHTKCITEEERYAAKGSLPNGVVKKGEVKQESLVEMIKSILETEQNLSVPHRNLLNTISNYTNIPRKKQKFMNFIKSSSGGRANLKDVEAVWNIIEKYKNQTNGNTNGVNKQTEDKTNKNEENLNKRKNTEEETVEVPKKKKKKASEPIETEVTAEEETPKFNFQEKILEILNAKESVSAKKLQKKVLNAYIKATGIEECDAKIIKKYNKKLKKVPKVEITENIVTLLKTDE